MDLYTINIPPSTSSPVVYSRPLHFPNTTVVMSLICSYLINQFHTSVPYYRSHSISFSTSSVLSVLIALILHVIAVQTQALTLHIIPLDTIVAP